MPKHVGQGKRQAAAGFRSPRYVVDHDKTTGLVRGLLCNNCNLMLGNFVDAPERLRMAASYLELDAPTTTCDQDPTACRECRAFTSLEAELKAANPLGFGALKNTLKKKYRVTMSDYYHLIVWQQNMCRSCGTHSDEVILRASANGARLLPTNLVLDHDHVTGGVRGLLCPSCNWGIGKAGDKPAVLRAGADYLEKSSASGNGRVTPE